MPPRLPNKITGANAGGRRLLAISTRWAARIAQFCRSAHCSAAATASQIMKPQQRTETQCGCPRNAARWGKAVGCGITIGTAFGTVVAVATKNWMFVYIGMFLGAAIGAVFKSTQTKSD
jgi:hypothetical protein